MARFHFDDNNRLLTLCALLPRIDKQQLSKTVKDFYANFAGKSMEH